MGKGGPIAGPDLDDDEADGLADTRRRARNRRRVSRMRSGPTLASAERTWAWLPSGEHTGGPAQLAAIGGPQLPGDRHGHAPRPHRPGPKAGRREPSQPQFPRPLTRTLTASQPSRISWPTISNPAHDRAPPRAFLERVHRERRPVCRRGWRGCPGTDCIAYGLQCVAYDRIDINAPGATGLISRYRARSTRRVGRPPRRSQHYAVWELVVVFRSRCARRRRRRPRR
jgi:hypothetical protein